MSKHSVLNPAERRTRLFTHLDDVLAVAAKKFEFDKKADVKRLKWGRLITQAVQVYGGLLQTAEIEQLAQDVEAIKQQLGALRT